MSDEGTLDEVYFNWLCSRVRANTNKNPARSYWLLTEQLYKKPFRWSVSNDDNRAEDGKSLRDIFSEEEGYNPSRWWMELECSTLEMMVALSERVAFESFGEGYDWFWVLIENLDLRRYSDEIYTNVVYEDATDAVDYILEVMLDRLYKYDGTGGLFPLEHPTQDQRKVEIWYQMASYLLERD